MGLATAGLTAARIGIQVVPSVRRIVLQHRTVDSLWATVDDGHENQIELTAKESEDLDGFLQSEETAAFLRLTYLVILLPSGQEKTAELETLRQGWLNLVEQWAVAHDGKWKKPAQTKWRKSAETIWPAVVTTMTRLLPSAGLPEEVLQAAQGFTRFIESSLASKSNLPSAVAKLVEMSGNLSLLIAADRLSDLITDAASAANLPPMFSHLETEDAVPFDALFVARDLTREHDARDLTREHDARDLYIDFIARDMQSELDEAVSTDEVFSSDKPFRAVLMGTPGAGKSTLVTHLARASLQTNQGANVPILVMRCREYATLHWEKSLSEALRHQVLRDFGVGCDIEEFEGALLLGRIAVIFDGLDEINNLQHRIDFTQRLNAFTYSHPLTSMIVTTRIVGYQRSPIDPVAFEHFRLREFTHDQIDEYAERWFGLMGRPELRESFMNESRSVDDLRTNPLMLSLLCSLFKAHGTIPRNRLTVYRRCADLLFYQWDSARKIQQNEDLPDFGNRLMEEIARLFYGSQAAQNGIEEGQLVRIIGTYLQDYAGVPQGAARRRGQEFLDFCAGRAWLLARLGTNSSGINLFGFTHRTFFEYFAAESLARMSDTPQQVADAVMKAYGSDSTSVLPELLIQAYEDKSNHGASRVFECVSRARIFEADLALRLMNTTLRRDVRRIGFERIVTTWGSPGYSIDQTTFLSLVFLHEEPRLQFVDDYLLSDEGQGPSTRKAFLDGWSALASTGQFSQISGPWKDAVEEAVAKHAQDEIRNPSTTSRILTKSKVNRPRSR